jgi:hypothetical protein
MNSYHWPRAFLILLATCVVMVVLALPASAECKGPFQPKNSMPSVANEWPNVLRQAAK